MTTIAPAWCRWFVAVSAALATVAAGGCATTAPEPASGPEPIPFPPRPAVVDVAAIMPCEMFDRDQQARLGLRRPRPGEARVNGQPSPACGWASNSDVGYNTQLISLGAEIAAADPAATIIEVNGFGAVRNSPNDPLTAGRPFCQVSVDAAPGQSIRVQVNGSPSAGRTTEEMCRLATEATSMVMTTVVARG